MRDLRRHAVRNESSESRFPAYKNKEHGSTHNSDSPANGILSLQTSVGNRAVQQMLNSRTIQAKLRISQPNDKYEQEADHVADAVMRMPEPSVQRQIGKKKKDLIINRPLSEQIRLSVQRQVQEEEEIQGKGICGQTPNLEAHINAIRGGGRPLPVPIQTFFEQRFGANFDQVRVHTDEPAAESAKKANAKAFTIGKDVVFAAGQYSPETSSGKRLLAHELTHVVQQDQENQANTIRRWPWSQSQQAVIATTEPAQEEEGAGRRTQLAWDQELIRGLHVQAREGTFAKWFLRYYQVLTLWYNPARIYNPAGYLGLYRGTPRVIRTFRAPRGAEIAELEALYLDLDADVTTTSAYYFVRQRNELQRVINYFNDQMDPRIQQAAGEHASMFQDSDEYIRFRMCMGLDPPEIHIPEPLASHL